MEMIERARELAAEMRPAMIDFAQRGIRCPSLPGEGSCLAPFSTKKGPPKFFSGFQKWSGLRTGNVCFPGGARALAEHGGCGSHPVLDCRASPLESPPTLGRGKRSIRLAHCERTARRHVGPAVIGQAG